MNFFAFIKKPIKAISLIIILFSFTSACNEQSSQDLASKSVTQTKKQVQVLLTGIDVSNYNTNINWQAVVDSGVAFVFIKATEGITYTDPMLSDHSAKVQEAGLTYGYYHFFRPKDDPIAQANHYLETVSKLKQSKRLPLVIDIEVIDEVTAAELLMSLEKFVDYLEKKGHRKPIIYSYSSFWNENFKTKFDNYPTWIADYSPYQENPSLPSSVKDWNFWQFTQKGKVPGLSNPVDRSFFNGSYQDLQKLVK